MWAADHLAMVGAAFRAKVARRMGGEGPLPALRLEIVPFSIHRLRRGCAAETSLIHQPRKLLIFGVYATGEC